MPVIAYPDHLPTFLKASKTRRQGAAFSGEEVRRGYAYFKKTGPDVPVYWDVTFRFNRFQAIQFWLWFTLKLRRGINEFTIPIDTEGTLSTHRCRFVPDSLLPAQEYGGVWTYTATIESRGIVQGEPAEVPLDITAFLLDTFTAANGTDPTSRAIDVHPVLSELHNWRVPSGGYAGVINNNSLVSPTGAYGTLEIRKNDTTNFTDFTTTTLYLSFEFDASTFGAANLYCKDETVDQRVICGVYDDSLTHFYFDPNVFGIRGGESGWSPDDYLVPKLPGLNKIALHLSADIAYAIANGITLGSASISGGGGQWLDHTWAKFEIDVSPSNSVRASVAGLYGDITLDEAIALTSPYG